MQYTTNYSLKKPQYADEADIEVINDNTDDVDTLIHQNRTMIAPAFDNTKAYVTGDPVEYLGALYVFTSDKAAGAWDASKVEPTTAAEMGSGGASALADLDDVEITNPSQGQALLFDDDDVWRNQTLPDVSVTKEASGNPIELTDAASAPLVKCVTQITGYQQGSGTPSPDNIRPIVAYTEGEIEVRGKNMCSGLEMHSFDSNGLNNNGPNNRVRTPGYIKIVPSMSYTVNAITSVSGKTVQASVSYYETDDFTTPRIGFSNWANVPVTVNIPSGAKYIRFLLRFSDDANVVVSYFNDVQLEQGTTPTTYEPYTSTTHTTTYPTSIYRGSEDCVEGEVETEWGMIASYAGETLLGEWISDRDEYAPGTTPTTGAQVAYALATPTTSSVTPTNIPIKSLSGYNHIESSTGDMEIEYITKTYEPLVDLIEASDHIYSTQEQIVGTWVDGKTLYEQTLYLASASVSSGNVATMPTISGVESVMVMGGSCYDVNDQRYYPLPYIRATDSESLKIQAHVAGGALATIIFTAQSSAYSLNDIYVVVRYTKASSNNRSLSAPVTSQKSISEPLTDKTEEVPTEEEKTVEKPETEEETNETER